MKNLTRLLFLLLPLIPLLPGAASAQNTTLQVFEISGSDWLQGLRSPDTSGQSLGSGEIRFPAWEGSPFSFSAGDIFAGARNVTSGGVEIISAGRTVAIPGLVEGLRNTPETTERLAWAEFQLRDFDPGEGLITSDNGVQSIYISGDTGLSYSAGADGGVPPLGTIAASASGAGGTVRVYSNRPSSSSSMFMGVHWISAPAGSTLRVEAVRFGIETTVVPEPSAFLLTVAGAALPFFKRRRRTVRA